ncbi:MAG TPA: tetratricopeptide repeat protein, partial [bacterium (Candidatus Stahlbacteria)]|nr:tetratricopeptide repeat protein [Candidatus Stahlbacteria bacterium]
MEELAFAANTLGNIYRNKGDYAMASNCLRRSLTIREKISIPYDLVSAYNNIGILYKNIGEWNKAIKYYNKALEIANRIGDIDGQAMLHNNLGIIYKNIGRWSEAEQCFRRSAEIWERIGDMGGVAYSLDNLGVIFQKRGELDKGEEFYGKSLRIAKVLKDDREIAVLYEHMGELYLKEGALDKSLNYLQKGLRVFEKLGIEQGRATVLTLLGELYLNNNEYDNALKLCESAIDIAITNNLRLEEANARRVLASVYGTIGEIEKAKENFAKGIALLEELGAKYELGRILLDTGYWILDKGLEEIEINGIKGSLSFLNRAKEIFERIGAKMELQKTLDAISRKERVSLGLPERPDRLVSLYKISQIVNSLLDLDQLLTKIMDLVNVELKAERGLILLMDDRTNELNPIVARNLEKETIKDATKISNSVINRVLKGGKPIISSDVANDSRFKQSKSVVLYNIRSLMCVPLIIKSKIIGAIYVDSRVASHIFDEEDLRFLSAFANIAAVAIDNARLHSRLAHEYKTLKEQVKEGYRFEGIIGMSEKMQKVYALIDKVTKVDIPVLILGETGTGKELVARTIHYNSKRRESQFVPINCGAIPEDLLESELFGYVKGAFTEAARDKPGLFEEADQGTIFLDEIGDMSLKLQAKLLRVLENGEVRRLGDTRSRKVDVRIISASNKDLKKETQLGKFREDLYYRINVMAINLPPLRERKEDIPLLASHFLNRFAEKEKKEIKGFASGAMELLTSYDWPGNVRELKNEIERAVTLSTRKLIAVNVLSDKIKRKRRLPDSHVKKADLRETIN